MPAFTGKVNVRASQLGSFPVSQLSNILPPPSLELSRDLAENLMR